jgi:3' terminal RNA ribose 2'-O-methyltransferase Hen1
MLLMITTTHRPATDLGFVLAKHPDRVQRFELGSGVAHFFYPEAGEARCTAALLLELDPVGLVRGRGASLDAYVNDRPYVASSFLAVAIAGVLGSALNGRCRERPELAAQAIALEARLAAVRCRGGEALVRRLFEPLGYEVGLERRALDEEFAQWGDGPYFALSLKKTTRVKDLLAHLYVLVPAMDNDKHYFVGESEVDKLVAKGREWLAAHPERELVAARFLKYRSSLAREALARLRAEDEADAGEGDEQREREEQVVEERIQLAAQRVGAVLGALRASGATSVLDLGCGEGRLLRELLKDRRFSRIAGVDVSVGALERARDKLRLDSLPERQRERIALLHGSLCYRDARFLDFDAACAIEVIEHIEPDRIAAFERVVFGEARPRTVIVTTPNSEYNVRFENLPAGRFRHRDHRFEWSRAELAAWSSGVGERFGYSVRLLPIGPEDAEVGAPTQMAVFSR